jgi:hypothetical protein
MALTEIEAESFEPPHLPTETVLPHLYPVDRKILGGIALINTVNDVDLAEVKFRLENVFGLMRADASSEAGNCVAYGYNLNVNSESRVDELLLTTAKEQNHGMLTQQNLGTSHTLWVGRDRDRYFMVHKNKGPIILDDGSMPSGIVYSLLSHRFNKSRS